MDDHDQDDTILEAVTAGPDDDLGDHAVAPAGSDGIVSVTIEEDPSTVIEVELDLAELDEVPIVDETETVQRERRFRWTPGLGVSTKPAIRVGVMLGGKRGGTDGDKS